MKKYLARFSSFFSFWPYFILLGITLVVAHANYTPGTYLTGWDNLHPEFDFGLNITRSLQAVWQEYQGVGLLGGMAHASDLLRQVFLWGLSLALPSQMLRYVYHFLMLFIGMSGIYFILSHVLLDSTSKTHRQLAALTGSLFYLFNLGTIQYFYVPFEPYSTFWGFFPWEIASLLLYLRTPSKKYFLLFLLINILATPQAYVQTIFLVYIMALTTILICLFYKNKSKAYLARIIKIGIAIFAINAFWLLPNLYFVLTNLSVTQDAMQNQMATEKFFQMNKNRGTIDNLIFLKEFYFDFFDFNDATGRFEYMMSIWRNHFASPLTFVGGVALFLGAMSGVVTGKKYRLPLLGLLGVCLLVFLSDTFGVSILNSLLRLVPIVNQIFRNPFTKFIVPLVFLFSVGLGLFINFAMDWLHKKTFSPLAAPFIAITLLLITAFPIFQGYLISPTMRVSIPHEYFDLFSYFKLQDKNARIMNLPQGGFWGWYYYKWGLRGSGFLWYGIEQPVLDRAFDVWSKENENYYWELSLALQKRNQEMFNAVLEKYQVKYVLYDNSLLFADNINSLRYAINQEDLLKDNPKVHLDANFGSSVRVYKVDLENDAKNYVLGSELPPSSNTKGFSDNDRLFRDNGLYTENLTEPDISYPFYNLFTKRTTKERGFKISENDKTIDLEVPLPAGDYALSLPSYGADTAQIPVTIQAKEDEGIITVRIKLAQPIFIIGQKALVPQERVIEVALGAADTLQHRYILSLNDNDYFKLDNIGSTFVELGSTYLTNANNANSIRLYNAESPSSQDLPPALFNPAKYCGTTPPGSKVNTKISNVNLSLEALNTANCTVYKTPLSLEDSSLIGVSFLYQSSSDEFPQYCIYSQNTNSCLNKKDLGIKGFSLTPTLFTDYFEANRPNDTLYFHSIVEAQADEDRNKLKKITYSQIGLTSYPYLSGANFAVLPLQGIATTIPISNPKTDTLVAKVPLLHNAGIYTDPVAANRFKTTALNYDSALPGSFSLDIKKEPKRLSASASDASSYILLRANNLSTQTGYLLKTTTRHQSGFPFVLNVFTNQEFRSHLYTYAPLTSQNSTSYYVLPPLYPYDNGLSFLLGTNSYNSTLSSNDLVALSATPLPYELLTGISLHKSGIDVAKTKLTSVVTEKKSLTRYILHPDSHTRFITLSQGYNSGWKAYQLDNFSSIKEVLPFFFARPLVHTRVNNWENGWELPKSGGTVVIIYLPQMLEYLGALLFGVLLLILLYSDKEILWKKAK